MIPIHRFSEKGVEDIKVNELKMLNNYDFDHPHRHDYFEFFIFIKGGGVHLIDFEEFIIHPNSIHIVAPGQVHQVKRSLNSTGFVLLFNTSVFQTNNLIYNFLFNHICFDVKENRPSYQFDLGLQMEVSKIANQIWQDYSTQQYLKNEYVLSNLNLLCIFCERSKKRELTPEYSNKNNTVYFEFRRMVLLNYKTIKKVSEYASVLNITEKQLNEVIKIKTGDSASSIIFKQIILEAKRLLHTGMSVKEVAFDLNFDDPAHFSKFFKTQTGISPSQL